MITYKMTGPITVRDIRSALEGAGEDWIITIPDAINPEDITVALDYEHKYVRLS